nr:uncharacterized protein LOC111993324 [Quercus suber]
MSVGQTQAEDINFGPKRAKVEIRPTLSFSDEDKIGTIQPHDNALVITLRIGGYDVRRVMVDQDSSVEIMYPGFYKGLHLNLENLTAYNSLLVSFDGKVVIPKGQIRLPVQAGSKVVEANFIVVDAYSPYTAIMAKPWLHTLGVVSSTLYQKVKYPSGDQIEELVVDQSMAQQCLVSAISHQSAVESSALDSYVAPGVDPNFIYHHLNVNPAVTLKKQPSRRSSKEHSDAVKDEVKKLKRAGAIKEVFYPEWLANIVVVKKKSGKWRVYVDFTDLNKAYPKDLFPMPRIDQLVDATVVHPRMSFLDSFQGYHHISLALDDQEKTAFITPTGNYHYKLKEYLSWPPIMSRPEVDEVLFAYIAVASHAVSLVLILVDDGVQRPVYYMSKSLHEAEVRYLPLEMAILAVVHATRKLPHLF